jgi:uncharacterized protein (DUF1810 family)
MKDPFNLQRFVDAQDRDFEQVCSELRQGRKYGHWMWYVFPQLKGLGHSYRSNLYGISSLDEARAYMKHETLAPRLTDCTRLVNAVEGRSIRTIFGWPDDLKFRSSMTLFIHATSDDQVFKDALQKYFAGEYDPLTIAWLGTTTVSNRVKL